MATRWLGRSIPRHEDTRLLTGKGRFLDDIEPPGTVHAAFVRAPIAHGRVRGIDIAAVRDEPGYVAVFTYDDLGPLRRALPLTIPNPGLTHPRTQKPLVDEKVCFAGEPVAMIIAEDRYLAEDLAELVRIDYEELPVVIGPTDALSSKTLVHDDVPNNRAALITEVVGDPAGVVRAAPHVLRRRLVIERSAGMPLEGRGVVATFDPRDDALVVFDSTQSPTTIKAGLSAMLGLPEHRVTVLAPDVGGGFGTKLPVFYPEEVLVPFAALQLHRPVKWVEDRWEHFVGSNHERRQDHGIEIAFDDDGVVLAMRDHFVHDSGAYCPYGVIVPLVTIARMRGPYRIEHYEAEVQVAYTNTQPVNPYRGAGGPQGAFVMERAMDLVARELDIDRAEVRRRNLIAPDEFPFPMGVVDGNGAEVVYDSGDYEAGLDLARTMIGWDEFDQERSRAKQDGRLVGIGIGCYVEGTGYGPYEGVRIHVETSGKVHIATGISSQGQGHETVFTQVAADVLGVSPTDVVYESGDTRGFAWATGTFASRSAVLVGGAVQRAAQMIRERALEIAGNALEASPNDLEIVEGVVRVKGSPEVQIPLRQVAILANPIRYAFSEDALAATQFVRKDVDVAPGAAHSPGLEAVAFHVPERATYASGCHAAIVEVDPELGRVRILRYAAVHDCGTMLNPAVVTGQVHGGIAQGIGGALYERLHHDPETGQLSNANFMDFLMPYATEIPALEVDHIETPTPLNELGIKGAGEAGAIVPPAVIVSAVSDAIGRELDAAPLSFEVIARALGS